MKPTVKPAIPNFSSGPCAKRPGYSLGSLPTDILGRSHRSNLGKARLAKSITETKAVPRLGGGMVTLQAEILNQAEQIVQHGGWMVLMKSRAAEK